MENKTILKILSDIKDEARKRFKAEIKGICGSYAREEAHRHSDIDILVKFEKTADLFDFVGLGLFLEEKLKRKVDIVPVDDIREELRESILNEAIYL